MGIFSEWQPRYAEQGVSTFPITIDGKIKKPAIKGYAKVGLKASLQLSFKFYAIDALACMMGMRNGITVIDIDSPDEDLLRETLKQYGNTPLIIRTGSGGFHCYYTNAGEDRLIRPDPDIPVDQLGKGVLVLPPSIGGKNPYEIIRGRITDLNNLPFIRVGAIAQKLVQDVKRKMVQKGTRNKELFVHLRKEARHCDTFDSLLDVARTFADDQFMAPLPDAEVVKTAKSVWDWTQDKIAKGEYFVGTGKTMILYYDTLNKLMPFGPHTVALYMYLKLQCGGMAAFYIANEMRHHMPDGEWTLNRLRDARNNLINAGVISKTRTASTYQGAAVFEWN